LAGQQAGAVLERIGRGELRRSILIWVPLMAGASEAVVVQEWVRLAKEEPNAQRRSECAGLALVFAGWAGQGTIWKQALEGFGVEQIDFVREWKDSARLEVKRSDLLRVLRKRFPPEVPADLTQMIDQMTDLQELSGWFDSALDAPSLDAFRSLIHSADNKP